MSSHYEFVKDNFLTELYYITDASNLESFSLEMKSHKSVVMVTIVAMHEELDFFVPVIC